jgi:hypothetical protein
MHFGTHYQVFMDRRIYNLRWAPSRLGGSKGVEELIDKYEINIVVVTPGKVPAGYLEYFLPRYPDHEQIDEGYVIRVRP